jgi:hypothetical protein
MGKYKEISFVAFLFLASGVFAVFGKSCGPLDRGEEEEKQAVSDEGAFECPSVSYSDDIYPMLSQKCGGCHGGASEISFISGDKDTDYQKILRLVQKKEGEESIFLSKATGKVAHGGGAVIQEGSEEYIKLKCWIDADAPKN